MAKKIYAVLCATSFAGRTVPAGSLVSIEEKDAKQFAGSLDAEKSAVDHYAKEFGAEAFDPFEDVVDEAKPAAKKKTAAQA